ncbi:MAG: hypothetical protein WDN00_15340 [Limisphaerales bacterium]
MSQCSNGASPRKLESLENALSQDFLRDVLDLAVTAGVAARGGEDARGILFGRAARSWRASPFSTAAINSASVRSILKVCRRKDQSQKTLWRSRPGDAQRRFGIR